MIELIYDKTTRITLPENADEISGKQFIEIAGIIHQPMNMVKARLKLLRVLSGKSLISFFFLSNDVKHRCLDHVGWIYEEWAITRQLIPKYRRFYGPREELTNLTLAEFYFSEKFYAEIVENDSNEALDSLISVLYRVPKRKYDKHKNLEGDIRQAFESTASEYYIRKIKRWPLKVKQAILLWYDACRQKIAKDNPDIFNGTGSNEDNEADMFGIMRGLSGGKYGTFKEVEKLLLHTALMEMNCILAENERLKAELEKHKT